jgi:hypothetical protein
LPQVKPHKLGHKRKQLLKYIRRFFYGKYASSRKYNTLGINIGSIKIYFSYDTIVAFKDSDGVLTICQNEFSNVTGKHLNWIDTDKEIRLPFNKFIKALDTLLETHRLV